MIPFIKINTYTCPNCGEEHMIDKEYGYDGMSWHSGEEIECDCGLVFTMNFDFDKSNIYDDDY